MKKTPPAKKRVPHCLKGKLVLTPHIDLAALERLFQLEASITEGIIKPDSAGNSQFDSWCDEFAILSEYMLVQQRGEV